MSAAAKYQREIAELAYAHWQAEGCPSGRELDHWLRAEQDVKTKSQARKPPHSKAKPRPTAVGRRKQS